MRNRTLESQIAQLLQEQERGSTKLRTLMVEKKRLEREFQSEVDRIVGRALRGLPELQPVIREKVNSVKLPRDRELLVRAGYIAAIKNLPDNPPERKVTK